MIAEAAAFAKEIHRNDRRRFNNSPFILHPMRVAGLVSLHDSCFDEMIAAAYLHDTVEDHGLAVTHFTIQTEFGLKISNLVRELTRPSKTLPNNHATRDDRLYLDLCHYQKVSAEAKIIKMYDRLDNLRECGGGPESWILRYCRETRELMEAIGDADHEICDEILELAESYETRYCNSHNLAATRLQTT